jgi:hypothetical protein
MPLGLFPGAFRTHDNVKRDGEAQPIGVTERLKILRERARRWQRRIGRLEAEEQG